MNFLIVDDQRLNLVIARDLILSVYPDAHITLCDNSKDVESIMTTGFYDIVFLDIVMPDLDGTQVLEMIRSHPEWDEVPILMLTAQTDDASLERCFERGATDYLTKPIREVEFKGRLRVAVSLRSKTLQLFSLVSDAVDVAVPCKLENE